MTPRCHYPRSIFMYKLMVLILPLWFMQSCEENPVQHSEPITMFWSMEDALKHPLDVHTLYLENHPIDGLPDTMQVMINLQVLIAPACNIDTLPNWICNFQYLEFLSLRHNRIAEFSPQIFCIHSLNVIDLRDNPISRIPDSLDRLDNIVSFSLDSCRLTSVPRTFVKSRFHLVWLNGNGIQSLPDSLGQMKKTLKYLNLSGNPIPQQEKDRILKELSPEVEVVF